MTKSKENRKKSGRKSEFLKYFNELDELKIWFLDTVDKEREKTTYYMYLAYMCKFKWYEDIIGDGKDICEYTVDEIDAMMTTFALKTTPSLDSHISCLNQYRLFANSKGHLRNRADIIYALTSDKKKELISKNKNEGSLITRKELYSMCGKMRNGQDSGLFICIFEGMYGNDFEKIKNLKKSDLNFENNFIIVENKKIKMNEDSMFFLKKASEQENYEKNNGEDIKRKNGKTYLPKPIELEDTKYIFRTTLIGNKINKKEENRMIIDINKGINTQVIRKRVKNMATLFQRKYLTLNNIWRSGMYDTIQRYLKEYPFVLEEKNSEYQLYQKILEPKFGKLTNSHIAGFKKWLKVVLEEQE